MKTAQTRYIVRESGEQEKLEELMARFYKSYRIERSADYIEISGSNLLITPQAAIGRETSVDIWPALGQSIDRVTNYDLKGDPGTIRAEKDCIFITLDNKVDYTVFFENNPPVK